MIHKRILVTDRVRRPPREGFSWVDRRFLREFASRLSREAIELYFFLAAVSDKDGLSFYRDDSIALRLRLRPEAIAAARMEIEALQCRRGRHAFRSLQAAQDRAEQVLDRFDVGRYLRVRAVHRQFDQFQQAGPGRPGPNTRYERVPLKFIVFEIDEDHEAIRQDAFADGLFPLITNSRSLSLAEALDKYKYQPFLEKRNEQLKNALEVAPIFLKKPERIASLLCIDFFALLVYALIERELRRQMKRRKIMSLPLYPEERLCKAPTADLAFAAFAGLRRHLLLDSEGNVLKTFYDPLPPAARTILELLDIDPAIYGIGG